MHIMPSTLIVFSITFSSLFFAVSDGLGCSLCGRTIGSHACLTRSPALKKRRRSALDTTHTDERLIAAAPIIGLSLMPNGTHSAPAAIGMPMQL